MKQTRYFDFWAYKTQKDATDDNYYFSKRFDSHIKLKNFSAKFGRTEKEKYPDFCSDYSDFYEKSRHKLMTRGSAKVWEEKNDAGEFKTFASIRDQRLMYIDDYGVSGDFFSTREIHLEVISAEYAELLQLFSYWKHTHYSDVYRERD